MSFAISIFHISEMISRMSFSYMGQKALIMVIWSYFFFCMQMTWLTIFAETPAGLQKGLDTLKFYCNRWKLTVNIKKTKIMIFRNGGILPRDMRLFYNNQEIEMVKFQLSSFRISPTYRYLSILHNSVGKIRMRILIRTCMIKSGHQHGLINR